MVDFAKLNEMRKKRMALLATPLGKWVASNVAAAVAEADAGDRVSDRRLLELDKACRDASRRAWAEIERAVAIEAAAQAIIDWKNAPVSDEWADKLSDLLEPLEEALKPVPEPTDD